jgi:hypothetical protein
MIRYVRHLSTAALFVISQSLFASDIQWQYLGAASFGQGLRCSTDNVTVTSAGNDLSILYSSSMAINLPAGDLPRIKSMWGHCLVFLRLTIPAGKTLTRTQASVIGGIEKDKGAYGYLTVVTYLTQKIAKSINPLTPGSPWGPSLYLSREILPRDTISEPLFEMNQSRYLSRSQKKSICKHTSNQPLELGMTIRLAMAGSRTNVNQTNIINVDAIDRHLDLAMNTEVCDQP